MIRRFSIVDSAQQMVGGFLLAGPFVVTEEVWRLAENMSIFHSVLTVLIVLVIGYGALYKADSARDPEKERDFGGVPLRLVSLITISYLSVLVLIFVLSAPGTFDASYITALKVMFVTSIFSVIGAATADTFFEKSGRGTDRY